MNANSPLGIMIGWLRLEKHCLKSMSSPQIKSSAWPENSGFARLNSLWIYHYGLIVLSAM